MRWLPLLVTLALCAVAAVLGVVAGLNARPSETEVITSAAAAYRAETGRPKTDCAGTPGQGAVWIVVRCGDAGDLAVYRFDRRGALIAAGPDVGA